MTMHPYRSAVSLDPNLLATPTDNCILCRTRRALARIPPRAKLSGILALTFLALNMASAAVAHTSMRDARMTLAEAAALERDFHAAVERQEARAHRQAPVAPPVAHAAREAPVAPTADTARDVATAWEGDSRSGSWHGISKVTETEFFVDRSVLDKVLEEGAELRGATRVVPEQEGGKVTGVRIYGIRSDTLLGTLGLMNGDSIQAINGYDVTRPERALEAYARLRNAGELWVRVKRRGSILNLHYHIG